MDLATLRATVTEKLGLETADLPEARLDRELNRVWRFGIPNRIDSAAIRGFVSVPTVASVADYDLDTVLAATPLLAVEGPVFYLSQELDLYSDPQLFWQDFDLASVAEGPPQGVLVQGRRITVQPTPDAAYTVRIYSARYRDALTSAGIADEQEATAVVDGAASRIAHELGQEDVGTRFENLFEADLAAVASRYRSNTSALPAVRMGF